MSASLRTQDRTPLRSVELSGGLPLIVHVRPGPAILAARLSIRGGSSRDPIGSRGSHQLLAGLMTRGCGDLDAQALADRVEGVGAALRAEAHEDLLSIGLKCAADDAESLLPLLPAMVGRPCLAADQLELERRLNLQALQRQREDPFQLAHDQLRDGLFGDGPYGHDPLGSEQDLAAINVARIGSLLPGLGDEGAVLTVCGDPPDHLVALLEEALAVHPWRTRAPQASPLPPSPQPSGRLLVLEQDTEQLVLMLGAATVPLADPDFLPLRLLQVHLGHGMSSRLFIVAREERGLSYDVGVHLPSRCGPSPFVMHLSTTVDRAAEATSCLLEEWRRMLEEDLPPAPLELARAKLRGQDAMGRQTCMQIAERQALVLSHGLPADHIDGMLARSLDLQARDLLAAARRSLVCPVLSLVGPAEALVAARQAWERHPLGDGSGGF